METSEQEQQRRSTTTADASEKGFGVAASPLNSVKFELGVVLCAAVVLWFAVDSITANLKGQLLILSFYGLIGTSWLVYRTRRVLLREMLLQEKRDNAP